MGPETCLTSVPVMLMLTLQRTKALIMQIKGERFRSVYFKVGMIEFADELNIGSRKREESTCRGIWGKYGRTYC